MQLSLGLDMAENRPDTRQYAPSRHDDAELGVSPDAIRPIRGDTPTQKIDMAQTLAVSWPADTHRYANLLREGSLDPVGPYRIFPFLRGDTPIRGRCFCGVTL
jgi:hypothetical protein